MKQLLQHLKITVITFSLFCTACENDIEYIEMDRPQKLTMNAFIYADSLQNELYLSKTGKHKVEAAGSATVEISVNGERTETILPQPDEESTIDPVYSRFPITTRFRPGDLVRIDARTDDGKHHVWIEERVPQRVEITAIDTSRVTNPLHGYYESYEQLRVNVHFKDRPSEKNYYRIVLEQREGVKGKTEKGEPCEMLFKNYQFWPWEDIALTDGRPATSEELETELLERIRNVHGVFDDSWFENNEYTLNTRVSLPSMFYFIDFIPEYIDFDVSVRLLSITESEFYYLSSLNIIDSGFLDDFVSDPVKVPSNVHGGTGFVGINVENGKTLKVMRNKEVKHYDY